jgi:3-oxoacyl-[acyl-carrier protein] reductase
LISKSISETTDEEIERVLEINFKGVFYSLREAAKHIREGGRIINISSSKEKKKTYLLSNFSI